MWIELLKAVEGHKVGAFLEVTDDVGRSYIGAGLAADGGEGPDTILLKRSIDGFREMLQTYVKGTADTIREAGEAALKRPVVRGVEFAGGVAGGESEADKSKSIGDFFRTTVNAISCAMTGDIDGARANHERLTKDYGVVRTGSGDVARASMTEGQGSSLGYTTPVIYESAIMAEAAEEQVFLARSRKVPLGARQVEYPALDQYKVPTPGNSAFYGGVQVYRKGEVTQRTPTTIGTKKIVMVAQDLTAFFELSRDLLQDSTAVLDSMIPQLGGEAIGWRCDWEAFLGTGLGQMLGVLNSPATMVITRALAARFTYADSFKMYSRVLPKAKKNAAWYVHPFSMVDVMTLKDESGRNVYLPVIPGQMDRGPIGNNPSGWLLGLPVYESEKCSPPGVQGDVNLFAMDRYLYGERAGLEVGLSEHFLFDTDQIAIRLKVRNDGKPQLLKPITLGDGTGASQVTAFVTLN